MRDTEWDITQSLRRDDREAAHRRNQGEEYRSPTRLDRQYKRFCLYCKHITIRDTPTPVACEVCGKP